MRTSAPKSCAGGVDPLFGFLDVLGCLPSLRILWDLSLTTTRLAIEGSELRYNHNLLSTFFCMVWPEFKLSESAHVKAVLRCTLDGFVPLARSFDECAHRRRLVNANLPTYVVIAVEV
jgi:hypothetical protein